MTLWRLFYHVVWGTKNRIPTIDEGAERILLRAIPAAALDNRSIPHAVGCMPDHVHMLISIPPSESISTVVGRIKGNTSHLLQTALPRSPESQWFGWQEGFGVNSVSERSLTDVKAYVEHQKQRHADRQVYVSFESWIELKP